MKGAYLNELLKSFFTKFGGNSSIDPHSSPTIKNELPAAPSRQSPGSSAYTRLPPLILAYVGDSVYEVFVRVMLAGSLNGSVHKLHTRATGYVRCDSQAEVLHNIYEILSEQERDIVRRGRNAHSGYVPKNASIADYRYATGFESLLGYLLLSGELDRLDYILTLACKDVAERKRKIDEQAWSAANGK